MDNSRRSIQTQGRCGLKDTEMGQEYAIDVPKPKPKSRSDCSTHPLSEHLCDSARLLRCEVDVCARLRM